MISGLFAGFLPPAYADRVTLNDGRVWEGRIISRNEQSLVIQTIGGPLTISKSDIKQVEIVETAPEIYQKRAEALAADDVSGHFLLGLWC